MSETTEETTQDSLAHGFVYFMNERDKDWFDKNKEEAHGDGTSAQGAILTCGTATELFSIAQKRRARRRMSLNLSSFLKMNSSL
jgi:enhancer of polycomb-like protein